MDLSPTAFRRLGIPIGGAMLMVLFLIGVGLLALAICYRKRLFFELKRFVIKATFANAARACGLNTNVRVNKYVDGKKVVDTKEYLPRIYYLGKRMSNNVGVVWRIRPAEGSTIDELANHTEDLANSLRVQQILIERKSPYQGEMTVLFGDPLNNSIELD